ncbi:MAG: GGDEF domain-containing protein [Lachnospiraceae bacterium]|nr:GGDEF domain-containing protein [Lachnospiraceae bacterium]
MKKRKQAFKNFLRGFWIFYALASIIITTISADKLITKDYPGISKYVPLDGLWNITINDELYKDVSLDTFRFSAASKNDIILIQRKLPDNWQTSEGVLRIHTKQAAIEVFINGQMVYEYGYDRFMAGKTVGTGYQFIDLPNNYKGKTLLIKFCVTEDNVFSKLDPIRIYDWKDAYRVIMTENRIPLFLGSFLLIFGLVTGIITIIVLTISTKFLKIFCVSMFSVCMGLWTLCYYDVILIFSIPLYSVSLLEYVSLYLLPIPMTVYMYGDVASLENKVLKILYWLLLSIQTTFITIAIALHTMDIVHFAATLKYMHIIIICSLIYFFMVLVLNLKAKKKKNKFFLAGMLFIIICIAYDLAGYCMERYSGYSPFNLKGVSSIGVTAFVFILIIAFYMDMTKKAMQETERNSLLKSAYTDELTQLHNRRYCKEFMQKIDKENTEGYTVFCFDLNNLKIMNDTYGHAKGDVLIQSAAEVIMETFGDYGIVARMGGDEFAAVLETSDESQVIGLTGNLHKNINKKNSEIENLNMSMAYGYACGSQNEHDIEKLYQIADNRMYEHKEKMKKAGLAAVR